MRPRRPDLRFENEFRENGLDIVAGLDEVGRGAWAGPVVAGAVILPLNRGDLVAVLKEVRDSKLCTPRKRDSLDGLIRDAASAVSIGQASTREIDALGIAPATRLAMKRAIDSLTIPPLALLIDYIRLRDVPLPQKNFPKGESLSISIAAASIVAKVARDRLMVALEAEYPGYGLAQHKGYGTRLHRAALKQLGPSSIHRQTFAPIRLRLTDEE